MLASGTAMANCGTRHLYNNTPVTFVLVMGDGTGSCSLNGPMKSACEIPSGQVGEIHYADTLFSHIAGAIAGAPAASPGQIHIMSEDGGKIFNQSFSVNGDNCYINHSGSTGKIAVNDPAKGDINTCGHGNWHCQ